MQQHSSATVEWVNGITPFFFTVHITIVERVNRVDHELQQPVPELGSGVYDGGGRWGPAAPGTPRQGQARQAWPWQPPHTGGLSPTGAGGRGGAPVLQRDKEDSQLTRNSSRCNFRNVNKKVERIKVIVKYKVIWHQYYRNEFFS